MEPQDLEAFNQSVTAALEGAGSQSDVQSESSPEDELVEDVNEDPDSSPDDAEEGVESEDEGLPKEENDKAGKPKDANQRIRQLLSDKKTFEEKAIQLESRVSEYEKQLLEVQQFAEKNSEVFGIAQAFATNPELVDKFKEFIEGSQNNQIENKNPYEGLPPAIVRELEENKRARGVIQQIQEKEAQREAERQQQELYSQVSKRVGDLDAQFEKLCVSSKIMAPEEKELLTQQIFLDAVQETSPELYEKVFMEVMSKLPDGYLENAFKRRSSGLQKFRSSVKKSLSTPTVPASGSKSTVPTERKQYGSIQELNDALTLAFSKQ